MRNLAEWFVYADTYVDGIMKNKNGFPMGNTNRRIYLGSTFYNISEWEHDNKPGGGNKRAIGHHMFNKLKTETIRQSYQQLMELSNETGTSITNKTHINNTPAYINKEVHNKQHKYLKYTT